MMAEGIELLARDLDINHFDCVAPLPAHSHCLAVFTQAARQGR